jgi:ssRNA-specific RNase YbeY (16S rRNA maturation enzyme)
MEPESVLRQTFRRKNTYLKSTSAVRVVNSRFGSKLKPTEVISLFVNSDYRDQSPELPVTEVSSASD